MRVTLIVVVSNRSNGVPISFSEARDGQAAKVLYCQFESLQKQKCVNISALSLKQTLLGDIEYDEYTDVHCRWEDETARENTGHPPSYAKVKKMKSLTFHKVRHSILDQF